MDIGTDSQWLRILRDADQTATRITTEDILVIAKIAEQGADTVEEAQRILDDPDMSRLLQRAWADSPPSVAVRAKLATGPAPVLLELAPPNP